MTSVATQIGDDDLYEVIDGRRVHSPLPIFSAVVASQIAAKLAIAADNAGRVLIQGLFRLPAISRDRRPDVAFVSYRRWPKTRSIPRNDSAWDVVPDLAIESLGQLGRIGTENR